MDAGEARRWQDDEETVDAAVACASFLEDHAAYIDGFLSGAEAGAHEAHAAQCASCGRYASVLRRGLDFVHDLPDIAPSAHFEERLKHRIFHIEDADRLERSGGRSAAGLAAAALLAMIAWSPLLWHAQADPAATALISNATSNVVADADLLQSADGIDDAVAARGRSTGRQAWYVRPTPPELEQTPVHRFVSYAGSYSPLIVSPPAARGPRAVRLVSATLQ